MKILCGERHRPTTCSIGKAQLVTQEPVSLGLECLSLLLVPHREVGIPARKGILRYAGRMIYGWYISRRGIIKHTVLIDCTKWQAEQGRHVDRIRKQFWVSVSIAGQVIVGHCLLLAPASPREENISYHWHSFP